MRKPTTALRASTYILVLGATLVVSAAGLSAVLAVRLQRRAQAQTGDFSEARFIAQSAIELGMLDIRRDDNWRTSKTNGPWRVSQTLGRGTFTLTVTDVDGNLTDDANDRVILTSTAVVADSRHKLMVELEPEQPPGMSCLASAVHVATGLLAKNDLTADAPVSSNNSITVDGGVVSADLEAVNTIQVISGEAKGSTETGIAAKEMPAATVFDYYGAASVEIPYNSLPSGKLRQVLLSPASNPYGSTHPQGLYRINCAGNTLTIEDVRIYGSLLILNPSSSSKLTKGIHWETYNPQIPALLVKGSIEWDWSAELKEGSADVNFNPAGISYKGQADTDKSDTYASLLKGLVYVSGNLTVKQPANVEGVVVCGGALLKIEEPLSVTYDPTIIQAPPNGFARQNRPMNPVLGSWRRLVD